MAQDFSAQNVRKATRVFEGTENAATYVGEYSSAAGMYVKYIRYDDGSISVHAIDTATNAETTAMLLTEGLVVIQNPNTPKMGVLVPKSGRAEYQKMIKDLVDGAFPIGATEIVPLLDRKSGNVTDIRYLSARKPKDLDPEDLDPISVASGKGYLVQETPEGIIFTKGIAEKFPQHLLVAPGGVAYASSGCSNITLPDQQNPDRSTHSAELIALGKKIVNDGVVDVKEAQEIDRAMQRVESATNRESTCKRI